MTRTTFAHPLPIHMNSGGIYAPRPGFPYATYWIAQPPNLGAPASAPPETVAAYWEHMVRACNSHDALVEALEAIRDDLATLGLTDYCDEAKGCGLSGASEMIRRVLAKAVPGAP